MQTTVEVSFVNQPKQAGGKYGSIKTADGNYYSVPVAELSRFQRGNKYAIEYDQTEKDGKTYRNFTAMSIAQSTPNIDRDYANRDVGKPNGSHFAQADAKDKFIFVTGVVGRAMGSGKFDAVDIYALTKLALDSYNELFASS